MDALNYSKYQPHQVNPMPTKPTRRKGVSGLILACLIVLPGCGTVGNMLSVKEVKPWERETLAKDNMQLDADSMDAAIDDHIYFSREASTGGSGVSGGGCGCN